MEPGGNLGETFMGRRLDHLQVRCRGWREDPEVKNIPVAKEKRGDVSVRSNSTHRLGDNGGQALE